MNLKDLNQKKNVDLTTVETGALHRIDRHLRRFIDTAFTAPGVALFIAGVVFGVGLIAR